MTTISVLFPFTFVLFNCGIQAKSLVDGMKNEREVQQDEITNQEQSLFENSRYPVGYGEGNGYPKAVPLYDMSNNYRTEVLKRSLREHNPSQRQTGIIYGSGKPIGILQPYQESFKFMPIKEERVYSLDGGRSSIDQQEPYINLMYPLARFTRSEDAIRMAELEAAKAEFLDKHYPSMLVDFKIHNKLHPTGYTAKSAPIYNIKREETNPTYNEMRKKKRESQSSSSSNQKLHKRDNQHLQKRESNIKKQSGQIAEPEKRETKKIDKREEERTSSNEKRESSKEKRESLNEKRESSKEKRESSNEKRESSNEKRESSNEKRESSNEKRELSNTEKNNSKMKRQSKITNSDFQKLKNSVSKRNSNGNIQVIEEDLKGLLSDMGLIEDDLEENAEEMEESRSSVAQDEDLEEGFDTTIQKDKEEPQLEQKGDSSILPERKKRAGDNNMNAQTSIPMSETRNSDSKKRTLNDIPDKRSVPNSQDNGKRFIEVSFTAKDNKDSIGGSTNEVDNCPKPSVIPNKREVINEKSSGNKNERNYQEKKSESKRSEETIAVTTENYEQYEQRVAREIKNKIKQLKEEVKRELGALDADKDEEDDEDSSGETQRKKRFIINTLIDEETRSIDPNENLDSSELEPHVRRRRTLSTDMISFGPEKSSVNSFDNNNIPEVNFMNFDPMSVVQNKFDFDVDGNYGESDGRSQSLNSPRQYSKQGITKKDILHSKARTRKANDYNPYMNGNSRTRRYRWDDPSMYMKTPGKMFHSEYQTRMPDKYAVNSRRNLRNDLNPEGNTFNSDYENDQSNSNSDEEAEMNMNSVLDLTRKSAEKKNDVRQQFSANEEHSPKKLEGYNQKYFYYYVGGNENEKKDNLAPSATNSQRSNSGYNYQRLSGQYPNQFYKSMNQVQNKQYTKGTGENRLTNKRAFQRRYDKPFGRRRKRYVNLMIPPKNKEHAIVSNIVYPNTSISYYPKFMFNPRSGNPNYHFGSKLTRKEGGNNPPPDVNLDQNMTSGVSWSNIKKSTSQPTTEKEKGKNISTTDHEFSGLNPLVPWNSVKNYENEISDEAQRSDDKIVNIEGMQEKNKILYFPHNKLTEHRQQAWQRRNYLNALHNYNMYSMPQLPQIRKGNIPLAKRIDEYKKKRSYMKKEVPSRKMLSWLHTNNSQIKRDNPQRGVDKMNFSIRYNNMNEVNDNPIDSETDEYEENYYIDSISTSTSKNVNTSEKPLNKMPENSTEHFVEILNEMQISNNTVNGNVTEGVELDSTTRSYVDSHSAKLNNSTHSIVNKNNLIVQNASLLSAQWKRRKRDIQPDEYQQNVRRKRSWYWPSLSFLHNNAPQIDEAEEFEQNESPLIQDGQGSKRSSQQSSFSFEDDEEGDGDFEDFANDPNSYDRDKRDTYSRSLFTENKSPFYYANKDRLNSYLPVSRNRRYVQGEFREPQQQLLTEISDAELFGALPQGYAGELARYKRVKRAERATDKT